MNASIAGVRTWAEMVKISHSVFALPFALMGAFLAGRSIAELRRPYWGQLVLVVVCMVAARSVAMTFNRIADAKLDARNPRTRNRPMPAGRLTTGQAWTFLIICAVGFVVGCGLFRLLYVNPWPLLLSVPVLAGLCAYSYTKRFTRFSHFYLGAAIAFSPVAAWIAIWPATLGLTAVTLMGAVTLWIAGFDIIYSCQDTEVDRSEGLFSLPSRVGVAGALWIARACHALTVALLVLVAALAGLGWLYLAGVGLVAALLVVENGLVKPGDLSKVNLAFFTINGVVSLVLGGLAIADIVLRLPAAL